MSKIKSLVTGGAGFIGSHLVESLSHLDHEVLVVDNFFTGKVENLIPTQDIEIIKGDIGEDKVLDSVSKFNPNLCFHLAAQSSVAVSVSDPALDIEYNLTQPKKLIDTLINTDCKRFLFTSSGGTIYGEPSVFPTSENDYGSEPLSQYGVSKKELNNYIISNFEKLNMNYSILNLANVYGPRQDPHGEAGVVSIFSRRMVKGESPTIFGSGMQTRDYVFVGDVVTSMLNCIQSDEDHFLNIGSGVEVSVLELVEVIGEITKYNKDIVYAPFREGDQMRSVLDSSLAKKQINWEPKVSLIQGINEVIEWVMD